MAAIGASDGVLESQLHLAALTQALTSVDRERRRPAREAVLHEAASSCGNAISTSRLRAPLHRRLWINDNDCLLLRPVQTELDEAQRAIWPPPSPPAGRSPWSPTTFRSTATRSGRSWRTSARRPTGHWI